MNIYFELVKTMNIYFELVKTMNIHFELVKTMNVRFELVKTMNVRFDATACICYTPLRGSLHSELRNMPLRIRQVSWVDHVSDSSAIDG